MQHYLDFEKSLAELETKIEDLRRMTQGDLVGMADDVKKLQAKADKQLKQIYSKLTPWQKTQVARHPSRPHFLNYINALFSDFMVLSGDRFYGDDQAIVGGLADFNGQTVMVMGTEKGSETESRLRHNFGMARPEGYRKAQRLMRMADRFGYPIITLVDTAGAYPGVGAEERGQSEAIAQSISVCLQVEVPLISVIIGEGGSGGAIALATANRVLMLEHSIYSVISPEGCASILWRSAEYAADAAEALKLTAQDLYKLKIIDEIIPEPLGGAHRQSDQAIQSVKSAITRHLKQIQSLNPTQIKKDRHQKFLSMTRGVKL